MSTRVLYISYTGLLDPLGQSQVLQYVLGLAGEHSMTLLTFEKPAALSDDTRLAEVRAQCEAAGVCWRYLRYHNRPNLPATLYDLVAGIWTAVRLARECRAQVVHCRSYIAGLMGLAVKRVTGAKYIFDMRGFWPDERVDGGIWRKTSLQYRVFKAVERRLFLGADHVVSLTRAGVSEFKKFDYLRNKKLSVTVIPTCTNLALFKPRIKSSDSQTSFTLGYVGSVGSWYMFEQVAKVVSILFEQSPHSRFKIINKGDHSAIRQALLSVGVDLNRVEIKSVPYNKVGEEIGEMDAGVFFIKPVWSKRASCPTRMGEFLACGVPCLTNSGVGDVDEDFLKTHTGLTISYFDDETLKRSIAKLIELAKESSIESRCRQVAKDRFSLKAGVESYSRIYSELLEG